MVIECKSPQCGLYDVQEMLTWSYCQMCCWQHRLGRERETREKKKKKKKKKKSGDHSNRLVADSMWLAINWRTKI
jgi:hypothetical protein